MCEGTEGSDVACLAGYPVLDGNLYPNGSDTRSAAVTVLTSELSLLQPVIDGLKIFNYSFCVYCLVLYVLLSIVGILCFALFLYCCVYC